MAIIPEGDDDIMKEYKATSALNRYSLTNNGDSPLVPDFTEAVIRIEADLKASHPTSDLDIDQITKDIMAASVQRDRAEAQASLDQKMKQGILDLLNRPYTPY